MRCSDMDDSVGAAPDAPAAGAAPDASTVNANRVKGACGSIDDITAYIVESGFAVHYTTRKSLDGVRLSELVD